MNALLIALLLLTFAFVIAAGDRLHLTARGTAMDWSPRRAPEPSTQQMEGITIMSADTTPGQGPRPPVDDEPGRAEVVDLDERRAGRPPRGRERGRRPRRPAPAACGPGR